MRIADIIKNEEQNQICLDQISELMQGDPTPESSAGVVLNVLAIVVEAFEKKHYPIGEEGKSKPGKVTESSYGTCADCTHEGDCDIEAFIFRSPEYTNLNEFGCIHIDRK